MALTANSLCLRGLIQCMFSHDIIYCVGDKPSKDIAASFKAICEAFFF